MGLVILLSFLLPSCTWEAGSSSGSPLTVLMPYNRWNIFLIWISLALIRVQPLISWETECRLCIMYLQHSALSVQIYFPHGIITHPGLPRGFLHFLNVSFPSVCVFIYPVCSNFKLLSCVGFLFIPLLACCAGWNYQQVFRMSVLKCRRNILSLPFRLLASLDTVLPVAPVSVF